MIWQSTSCPCAYEVANNIFIEGRFFKFMSVVNICDDHKRDTPEESCRAAHEYNMQVNIAKAAEEALAAEAEAQDG